MPQRMKVTHRETIRAYIDKFCSETGLPRDVVPNKTDLRTLIYSWKGCVPGHLPRLTGRPAQIVLFFDRGDVNQGEFATPNLERFVKRNRRFNLVPGSRHEQFGVLATLIPLSSEEYDVLYFTKKG